MSTQIDPELLAQVLTVLRDAVTNPAKDKATDLIEWIMDNYVTPQGIRYAMANNLDLFTLAFNHYGLGHSAVSPLFKIVARNYWGEIEDLLTDANKVLKIVSKKPECAQILYTPEGIDYLNRCCIAGYENLYNFVWN
uniref:Uncharacterized protein n=1 Tax=viral metagenome TaxID=1070528 RepID=A0A6M3M4B8_9ZZZZ